MPGLLAIGDVTRLAGKRARIGKLRGALYRTWVRADASGRRWLSNSRRDRKQYSRGDGHTPTGCDGTVHHEKVLKETKGDKIAAARILGIGKTTIYRKLRQSSQNPIEPES